MAASRSESPDNSMSTGSNEYYDRICDTCKTASLHVKAHGYCVECQEYMCNICLTVHRRSKATKHHRLLEKDDIDGQGIPRKHSNVCSKRCSVHNDEIIKYFCNNHELLGCHACMILHHKSCEIDYIPEKCTDIEDSVECRWTTLHLKMKAGIVNSMAEKARSRVAEIDTHEEELSQEIDEFEKEIKDRIQQIRIEIKAEINEKKTRDIKVLQDVLDTCADISSDVKNLESSIKDGINAKQNCSTYIAIKQALTNLNLDDIEKVKEKIDKTNMQHQFLKNEDLRTILSKESALGKLTLSATLVKHTDSIPAIARKEDMDFSDTLICEITGCIEMPDKKVLLADYANSKLKLVDTQDMRLVEEKNLDSEPWDTTVIPNNQIVVTFPNKKEVHIMDTKLTNVYTIPVDGECMAITYRQGFLYVACCKPACVIIMDTNGNVFRTINIAHIKFRDTHYIEISKDLRHIYVCDWHNSHIVAFNNTGAVFAKPEKLPGPRGMALLPDGSLLVCYYNGKLEVVTEDLQQRRQVVDGLHYPQAICYSQNLQKVYIGGYPSNRFTVLSLKKENE